MSITPKPRPTELLGHTHKVIGGCGKLYVLINHDDTGIVEIFASLGKTGQCGAAQMEALCRSVSIGLRAGVSVESYIKQLEGIRCSQPTWDDGIQILSCADGIALALRKELEILKNLNLNKENISKRQFITKMNEEGETDNVN